jgi:hypothetical protein
MEMEQKQLTNLPVPRESGMGLFVASLLIKSKINSQSEIEWIDRVDVEI